MKPTLLAAILLFVVAFASPSPAQAPAGHAPAAKLGALQPALAGLGFLVGEWSSGEGRVADTSGTSTGRSTITVEAGGAALLRRDHTDLFDKAGKPSGGFEQIMLIYPEAGAIHADYTDGTHVIHYIAAAVDAGQSVTFTGAPGQGPVFHLSYEAKGPKALAVSFGMTAPGGGPFQPIATGTLTRR
jgi:hypothetical protein